MSQSESEESQVNKTPVEQIQANSQTLGWSCHPAVFVLIFSLLNTVLYHGPLLRFASANLSVISLHGALTIVTLFVLVCGTTSLVLAITTSIHPALTKLLALLIVLCNTFALYFIQTYRVLLDRTMMGNVLNTDLGETADLFHPQILIYLGIFGLFPAGLILMTRIRQTRFVPRLLLVVSIFVTSSVWIYANGRTWLWFDQHFQTIGALILPWSYVANTIRYQQSIAKPALPPIVLPNAYSTDDRKAVVVLVIGESARAQNFSIYGYSRQTNPLLKQAGAFGLPFATACATYTTAAINCITSHQGSKASSPNRFENLPTYLHRNGVEVLWRTNNWGEPPMTVASLERSADIRRNCDTPACNYDEVLLHELDQTIASRQSDKTLIVLHQSGSHGPSYWKKTPDQFRQFWPICESVDLQTCTHAELVNAYDNTVLYTDYFLSKVITMLSGVSDAQTTMIYVSDHGESLGEYGLYLHGTPMALAPDTQTQIPFIVWMSDAFRNARGVQVADVLKNKGVSHDNVFHSVMGALGLQSQAYRADLDVFERR